MSQRVHTFILILGSWTLGGLLGEIAQADEVLKHLVRAEETLSEIVQKVIPGRIWGPNGALQRTLALNPGIEDPHFIYPGQTILLAPSTETAPRAPAAAPLAEAAAPAAVATPIPASIATELSPPQTLELGLDYGFVTVTATDIANAARATLRSSYSLAPSLRWTQSWSSGFRTAFTFGLEKIGFEPSTNPAKTLGETSKTLTRLEIAGSLPIGERIHLGVFGGYGKKLFVRALSNTQVGIDAIAVPTFGLSAEAKLLTQGRSALGLAGTFAYVGGATTDGYVVSSGRVYSAGGYYEHRFGAANASAARFTFGFSSRRQNTSLLELNQDQWGAGFQWSLPIFTDTSSDQTQEKP